MASYTPPLMGLGSVVVVTIGSLQKHVAIIIAYISKFFWKTIIGTSTSLPINQSYL
jgi:hypothetical protein